VYPAHPGILNGSYAERRKQGTADQQRGRDAVDGIELVTMSQPLSGSAIASTALFAFGLDDPDVNAVKIRVFQVTSMMACQSIGQISHAYLLPFGDNPSQRL